MATFTSPCTKKMLSKLDTAPMPVPIKSTFQAHYITPSDHQKLNATDLPQISLSKNSGYRLMPTKYIDFYKNCISTLAGDNSEMKFEDDTPEWKYKCRAAIEQNWLHPVSDRRNFIKTQQWNLNKLAKEIVK